MTLSVKTPQPKTDKLAVANEFLAWCGRFEPSRRFLTDRGYAFAKRALDVLLIGLAIPMLMPLFGMIALLIKLDSPNLPVFSKQKCVGKFGLRFDVYKFTTSNGYSITGIGNFLRMSGLDQLPQLFNVLKGDMTLVGPRPVDRAVEYYADHHLRRLDVTPGLTGLWQVTGDASMSFDESSALDIAYVNRRRLWLDIVLLLYTVVAVVK